VAPLACRKDGEQSPVDEWVDSAPGKATSLASSGHHEQRQTTSGEAPVACSTGFGRIRELVKCRKRPWSGTLGPWHTLHRVCADVWPLPAAIRLRLWLGYHCGLRTSPDSSAKYGKHVEYHPRERCLRQRGTLRLRVHRSLDLGWQSHIRDA
jgi:hypothetical protein